MIVHIQKISIFSTLSWNRKKHCDTEHFIIQVKEISMIINVTYVFSDTKNSLKTTEEACV